MAKFLNDTDDNTVYPKDPLDKKLLLSSMRDFAPDGLALGIEKMGNPFNKGYGVQSSIQFMVLGDMSKCRKYVLDENSQYIEIKDDITGDTTYKVEIGDGHHEMATIFFKLGSDDKNPDEETECKLTRFSSSYPLFCSALIENGDLPEEAYGQTIITNPAELKEALEGYEFVAKVGSRKYKGKEYNFIQPVRD